MFLFATVVDLIGGGLLGVRQAGNVTVTPSRFSQPFLTRM
jgi:hypothetical protein